MHDKDAEERHRKAVAEVSAEWDRRLAPLKNDPKFGDKVDAIMDAQGRTKRRPKAGETYCRQLLAFMIVRNPGFPPNAESDNPDCFALRKRIEQ